MLFDLANLLHANSLDTMASLIFRLRQVPDDEAEEIRQLLDKNSIDWYETTAGNWGISMPGIWVSDDEQAELARKLVEQYQQERATTQRSLHEQQKQLGQNTTIFQRIAQHPLQSIGIILFCLFILYVSIHPFLQLIGYSRQ